MLINGPLKLTRTPEFPSTMTEEQLRGYLESLAAGWPEAERSFSRGSLRDPNSAYADFHYQVALQTPLEMAMRIVDEQTRLDHRSLLPTLTLPVLALYGRHDPYYPASLAEYIAGHTPNGSYVMFEESAHAPQVEETERFCEVVGAFARGER